MIQTIKYFIMLFKKNLFLFEELVKRDFKKKYKRTFLGMLWSLLLPLLQLFVMSVVFSKIFGMDKPHYTTYLFAGNLTYNFFKDSTTGGMNSLMQNREIISKINLPKYMFLLSKNVASLINFGLTLLIFFIFVAIDDLYFKLNFFMLIYLVLCFIIFNIGCGFILSALFVIFKDIQYLYEIFTLMLNYLSAVFYYTDVFRSNYQKLFYLNPIYVYITYIRHIVIDGCVPGLAMHILCLLYAIVVLIIGTFIYKKYNYKFMYYM